MSKYSEVNHTLAEASTCPFWNMARTTHDLTLDHSGNAQRSLLLQHMMDNGLSKISAAVIDWVTAKIQSKETNCPPDFFNLTTSLNQSVMNHYAGMAAVDDKHSRVNVQQVESLVAHLESTSNSGIVDLFTLAQLHQWNFERDRDFIFSKRERETDEGPLEYFVRSSGSFILRLFYAVVIALGELALMLLVLGHRERWSRERILHTQEIEDFLLHGKRPKTWKIDQCGLLDVAGMILIMLIFQSISWIPNRLLRDLFTKSLVYFYKSYSAIANRIHFLVAAPFGFWTCANLISRKQLIEIYQT